MSKQKDCGKKITTTTTKPIQKVSFPTTQKETEVGVGWGER